MDTFLPSWLNSRIYFLKSQGRLNLSGDSRMNFEILNHPDISKLLYLMKILDISKTEIRTIEGFPFYKGLTHFVADHTLISDLRNFRNLRGCTSISLIGTPVSANPFYKLSLLIVCGGKNLKLIDGKLIPKSIVKQARRYSPLAAELVNAGWMAEWPCPTVDRLYELSDEYNVNLKPIIPKPIDIDELKENNKNLYTGEFESTLRRLKKRHNQVLKRGKALFGIIDEDDEEEDEEEDFDDFSNEQSGNDEKNVIEINENEEESFC